MGSEDPDLAGGSGGRMESAREDLFCTVRGDYGVCVSEGV